MRRTLKLPTGARHAEEVAHEAQREGWSFGHDLRHLMELEVEERRRRRGGSVARMRWQPAAFGFLLLLACGCRAPAPRLGYRALEQRQAVPAARPPGTRLSPAEVDGDLALLAYALERGYGGRHFVPAAAWQEMRARLARLRRPGRRGLTVEALCDGIAEAFWVLPDAHLSARRQLPGSRRNVKCGHAHRVHTRRPAVGRNRGAAVAKERPWLLEQVTLSGAPAARAALLAITAFPQHGDPVWRGYDEAVAALRQAQAAVIDLRGNGGGDDSRGFQLARALLDGPVQWGVVRSHRRQTPETLTLLLNTLDRIGRRPDGALEPHMRPLHARVAAWRSSVLAAPAGEYKVAETPAYVPRPGPRAFPGPVAILVDAACGSSCESSLEVLRLHPRARVFGERTAGYIHFGDTGSLTLPASGIRLSIPTKYNEYRKGAFYDKIGFAPDQLVPAGRDALEVAAAWLAGQLRR